MTEPVEALVHLTNDKVRFTGSVGSNPPMTCDYAPPLGDGEGYTGLELLLLSLAACSGTAVVVLLRKMHRTLDAFSVHASGIRREQHPTAFRQITLEFVITSPDVEEADIRHAIQLSEESICPVWAMLKGNVEITTTYRFITDDAGCPS